ncbi:MAG: hypothetical protein Q7T97_02560 [Burkholderiaceae bacterium]|nr:hypothetical protein [Burkholderiaceae bacterium]
MTLPRPAILLTVDLPMVNGAKVKKQPFYTEDQMLDAIKAATRLERVSCIDACLSVREAGDVGTKYETYDDGHTDGCNNCANAIFERPPT